MLSRARQGACEIVASAAFGSCLKGQDVVAHAAGGVRNRGTRSTLEMPLPKSWQPQHSVHLGVCLCGRGRNLRLSKGTGAAGGVQNRGRRSTLAMPLPKSWQAQHSVHLGVCLCGRGSIRQLSRGTGCWAAGGVRNRCRRSTLAMPLPKSWQAQHSVHLGVCLCGRGSIRQLSRGTGCFSVNEVVYVEAWGEQATQLGLRCKVGDLIALTRATVISTAQMYSTSRLPYHLRVKGIVGTQVLVQKLESLPWSGVPAHHPLVPLQSLARVKDRQQICVAAQVDDNPGAIERDTVQGRVLVCNAIVQQNGVRVRCAFWSTLKSLRPARLEPASCSTKCWWRRKRKDHGRLAAGKALKFWSALKSLPRTLESTSWSLATAACSLSFRPGIGRAQWARLSPGSCGRWTLCSSSPDCRSWA